MKKAITSVLSFSLLTLGCVAQTATQKSPANLKLQIDAIVRPLSESGDLNGNVLVVKNGEFIYEQSFGFADGSKEHVLGSETRFNVGSVYKELPAVAIMQLEEKGLLNIDDNLSIFLPELPAWANAITIENLMQYTAGLPRISWGKYPEITDEVLMNSLLEMDSLQYQPGTDYVYTNYSPYLLTKIVEEISKEKFTDYTIENIFAPAGMEESIFKTKMPYDDRTDMAMPFNSDFEEDALPFQIKLPLLLFSTTVRDLYKLNKAMHDHKLISESSMLEIAKVSDLETENKQSPLGNTEVVNGKITEHQHHGSSGNYECLIQRDNVKDITILILTNRKKQNLHEIVEQVSELL